MVELRRYDLLIVCDDRLWMTCQDLVACLVCERGVPCFGFVNIPIIWRVSSSSDGILVAISG